jgi:hypothetical protein
VLLGSILAFLPIAAWFAATAFGRTLPLDAPLLLAPLILFPLSVAVAIFRYRLLDVDHVVNRAMLYGALTAVLAGMYTISIMISQRLFVAVTGEKSDGAIVVTTLIVASLFTPIKSRLAGVIDRWLRETPDNTRALRSFSQEVNAHLLMSDAVLLAGRLLDEAADALQAESGAVSLIIDGRLRKVGTIGHWRGEAAIAVSLQHDGQRYGLLWLGPRRGSRAYSRAEFEALEAAAEPVAQALRLALPVRPDLENPVMEPAMGSDDTAAAQQEAPEARQSSATQVAAATR